MNRRVIRAAFATEDALLEAASRANAAGLEVLDVFAPYPLANVPQLANRAASDITRGSFAGGVLGAAGAVLLQAWTSAVDWPLDVGGKPALAWLSFVPVTFELMVLGAGIGAVAVLLWQIRARTGAGSVRDDLPGHPFVLELQTGGKAELVTALEILRRADGLVALADVRSANRGDTSSVPIPHPRLDRVLVAATIGAFSCAALLWPDTTRRNPTYAPDMAVSPAVATYETDREASARPTLRAPVPGTVPRGPLPLHYAATEADALRAATELRMPAAIAAETDSAHADKSFAVFCQPCHGRDGHGDGITIKSGFQPPPSLLTQHARDMKDGQMFHVLSYGQKLMPAQASQLRAEDRWRLIMHVRRLQEGLPVDPPPFGTPAPVSAPVSSP